MSDKVGATNTKRSFGHFNEGRRNLLKMTGMGMAAIGVVSASPVAAVAQYNAAWDKTFPKSDRVDQRKVSYTNRLGITLVADLYAPKDLDRTRRYPALVVGHPFGGVKEQTSGLYAQTMAERGFITLAHDASYNGESGGKPHFISSPDAFVEDFSAGVDFLGMQPEVARDRIGVIGVCASGGFALAAAQIDPRMRAVATVSMYDMGSERRSGLGHTMTEEDRRKALQDVAEQRWILQSVDPKCQRLEDMFAYLQADLAPEFCWIETLGGFPLQRCGALAYRRRIKVGSGPFAGEIHDGVTSRKHCRRILQLASNR